MVDYQFAFTIDNILGVSSDMSVSLIPHDMRGLSP